MSGLALTHGGERRLAEFYEPGDPWDVGQGIRDVERLANGPGDFVGEKHLEGGVDHEWKCGKVGEAVPRDHAPLEIPVASGNVD